MGAQIIPMPWRCQPSPDMVIVSGLLNVRSLLMARSRRIVPLSHGAFVVGEGKTFSSCLEQYFMVPPR